MNEKIKTIIEYVKTHKKEVAITILIGTGTIVLCVMSVKYAKLRSLAKKAMPVLNIIQIGSSKLTEEHDTVERAHYLIPDINIDECGDLGEYLCKKFNISNGEFVDVIISLDE